MFIVAANDQGSRHPLSSTANGQSSLFLFGGVGFQSFSRTSLRVARAQIVIRSAVKHYLSRKAIKAVNLTSGNSNNSHLKCLRRSVSFVVNLCCETKAGRRVKKQIISNGTRWFMMLFLTLDGFCDSGLNRIDSSVRKITINLTQIENDFACLNIYGKPFNY